MLNHQPIAHLLLKKIRGKLVIFLLTEHHPVDVCVKFVYANIPVPPYGHDIKIVKSSSHSTSRSGFEMGRRHENQVTNPVAIQTYSCCKMVINPMVYEYRRNLVGGFKPFENIS